MKQEAVMFSKIAIRNIPSQIFRALETLADLHDRSTEAEARQALRAWVEPLLVRDSRNTRRKDIAERLNRMLAQVNSGQRGTKLTPSHVAEAIQEERAEDVEDWFLGEKEPSFSQLSAIADFLGVDSDWLKHGDRALFPSEFHRLSENPFEAVDWLLSWDHADNQLNEGKLKTLRLIRAANPNGQLYIVKESDKGHFRTYSTTIHVSEEIGAGGETSLAALFVTLELLYKRYIAIGCDILIFGYQLPPDDIAQLMSGNTHPGSLLNERSRSNWWEDVWDCEMAPKSNYWPGWKSLHERIERVVSARTHLNGLRGQIRQGRLTTASADK
jgi:plasmid stability protein